MLENDLLLGTFCDKYLQSMDEKMVSEYEAVLEESDPDILNWITRKTELPEKYCNSTVLKMILDHADTNPMKYVKEQNQRNSL